MGITAGPRASAGSGVGDVDANRIDSSGSSWLERGGLALAVTALCVQVMPAMWQRSLWLDEGYTVGAMQNLHVTFSTLPGQMPLFFLTLTPWASLSLSPWWLRVPSLAASIAVLVLTRSIARRIGGSLCAAVAPVMLAVSPMFVAKAVEARPYAMVTLLVAICWYSYLRDRDEQMESQRSPHHRWMWLLAAAATIGPLFQGLFLVHFAAIVVAALIVNPTMSALRRIAPAVVGCAGSMLFLLKLSEDVSIGALSAVPVGRGLVEGYLSGRPAVALVLIILVLIGTLPALVQFRTSKRIELVMTSCWLVVPVLLALVVRRVEGVYVPRYLAAIAPAIAIAVAMGLIRLARALQSVDRRTPARRPITLGVVGGLLVALVAVGGPRPSSEAVEDWDGAARTIASEAHHGDCLAFAYKPYEVFQVFRAPFEATWNRLDRTPTVRPISPTRPMGTVRIWDALPTAAEFDEHLQSCGRIWIVTYRDSMQFNPLLVERLDRDFREFASRDFHGEITVKAYKASSTQQH